MTRQLLRLSGADTKDFLQGLVTNDVSKLNDGPIYAALLTPQGKYIADFFLIAEGADILIDVDASLAPSLAQRLGMYKLRADVAIAQDTRDLHRGLGAPPADGWADPRHAEMGWRAWRNEHQSDDVTNWDAIRVQYLIPETGTELTPDTFILEAQFEALKGVDFRKGCYVGQEVTARMKHKTELRKGLARVSVTGPAEEGGDITTPEGKLVGTLHTRSGDAAIAYLRFDRAVGAMICGDATVQRV